MRPRRPSRSTSSVRSRATIPRHSASRSPRKRAAASTIRSRKRSRRATASRSSTSRRCRGTGGLRGPPQRTTQRRARTCDAAAIRRSSDSMSPSRQRRAQSKAGPGSRGAMKGLPFAPPLEPMLAKLTDALPQAEPFLYEPKWDGFRALVFRGDDDVFIQSRDKKPLDRYFPELHALFLERLPEGCVLDGEIVIAGADGLDFDALQLRLHPAEARVEKLARETPAAFVAFDRPASGGRSPLSTPQAERRSPLERLLAEAGPPLYLTPMARDRAVAAEGLEQFEGAGLDGVVAKHAYLTYEPGKRA